MPRISTASAKAKGRKLQQHIRDAILAAFPSLHPDDVVSCPMGSQGRDVMLSQAAQEAFPFSIEAKARATGYTALYDALSQAERQDGLHPVAVIRQDRRRALAVMDLDLFISLTKK